MGRDKALVEIDGVPMARRVAGALDAAGCEPIVAIGGDPAALGSLGLEVVADGAPGEGPLGGLITALVHFASSPAVVVVACDLPYLTGSTVRAVVGALAGFDVALACTDRRQPLCAAWRPNAVDHLRSVFDAGERRLDAAATGLHWVQIQVDPQDLANVNTPADLPD